MPIDEQAKGLTASQRKYGTDVTCRCGMRVYYNNLRPLGERIIESESGNRHECPSPDAAVIADMVKFFEAPLTPEKPE